MTVIIAYLLLTSRCVFARIGEPTGVSDNNVDPPVSAVRERGHSQQSGAVRQLFAKVTADPMQTQCSEDTCRLQVAVTYTQTLVDTHPDQNGSRALVLFISGFLQSSHFYSAYAHELAKCGFCVLQYDCVSPNVPDRVELGLVDAALDWVGTMATTKGSPLDGLVDLNRIHAIGHSRGGKIAALLLAGWRPSPRAPAALLGSFRNNPKYIFQHVLLLDPVDSFGDRLKEPSAVEILRGRGKVAAVVGASVTGTCNPRNANYEHFLEVLGDKSQFQELDAGHMQFLDAGPVSMAFYRLICGAGGKSNADVMQAAVRDALNVMLNGTLPRAIPRHAKLKYEVIRTE